MPPGCEASRETPTLPRSTRLGRPARTRPPRKSWLQPAWPLWPQPPTAPGRSAGPCRARGSDNCVSTDNNDRVETRPGAGVRENDMRGCGLSARQQCGNRQSSPAGHIRPTRHAGHADVCGEPGATQRQPPPHKTPGQRAYLRTLPRPWRGPPFLNVACPSQGAVKAAAATAPVRAFGSTQPPRDLLRARESTQRWIRSNEVFSLAASLHGEDDEGGGGDVADPPRGRGRAEGDPAEGFEGLQEGVGAFGRGAQGAQEQLWVRLSGQRLAPL